MNIVQAEIPEITVETVVDLTHLVAAAKVKSDNFPRRADALIIAAVVHLLARLGEDEKEINPVATCAAVTRDGHEYLVGLRAFVVPRHCPDVDKLIATLAE